MISNIDLNPANFPDVVNIFILFRLKSFTSGGQSNYRNSLFGHDNSSWGKFVCFKTNGDLVEVTSFWLLQVSIKTSNSF